jgi:hypothetical protein
MNDLCIKCGKEVESNCFDKCDKCMGLITQEDLQKMSPSEKMNLRLTLAKLQAQSQFNITRIWKSCKHEIVEKGSRFYNQWKDEIVNSYDPKDRGYAVGFYSDDNCNVYCQICNKEMGKYCPQSPVKYCQYPENWGEEQKYGVSAAYCVFCKKPHRRYATDREKWANAFAQVGIEL